MSRENNYFLIARNREDNSFEIIPINKKNANKLEEIDLFTTNFSTEEELKGYYDKSKDNIDIFITTQHKYKGKNWINNYEVLYNDSYQIKDIATSFMNDKIEDTYKLSDNIFKEFSKRMQNDSKFHDKIIYGKTNIYQKFINYYSDSRYKVKYDSKYREGGWARKSYNLIRNLVEAMSNTRDYSIDDFNKRNSIEKELLKVTDKNYDKNQYDIFDYLKEEERIGKVLKSFESLEIDSFTFKENATVLKDDFIRNTSIEDFILLHSLLDSTILKILQRYTYNRFFWNINKNNINYEKMLHNDYNKLREKLLYDNELLENAYQWALLVDKYKDKEIGDINGFEYRK